jgi:hypothetical protein
MTREEKCLLAIEKGFTYNPETGKIYGIHNKEIERNINGYIQFLVKHNEKLYKIYAHHFAWYWVYKNCNFEQIDHINFVKNDNRIKNLRTVNNQQNHFNRPNVKGFTKCGKKYYSHIKFNGKSIHIGTYETEQEAREAYLKAKEKYHVI